MEIAVRGYRGEPEAAPPENNWPPVYDPDFATPLRADLSRVLAAALSFAKDSA